MYPVHEVLEVIWYVEFDSHQLNVMALHVQPFLGSDSHVGGLDRMTHPSPWSFDITVQLSLWLSIHLHKVAMCSSRSWYDFRLLAFVCLPNMASTKTKLNSVIRHAVWYGDSPVTKLPTEVQYSLGISLSFSVGATMVLG